MERHRWLLTAVLLSGVAVAACEGPIGPTGPAGPAGAAGATGAVGPAGKDGKDAAQTCTQCHTGDVALYAKQLQYETSAHRLGGTFERNSTSCAVCHTSQGFVERIATGATVTAATIDNPAPINCRTCHQIHTTYTAADYALRATAPVKLWASNATVDFGPEAGNLCAQCHQGRPVSPAPSVGGADVKITSSRYGFHNSPVAQVLGGVGAFEFSGPASVTKGPFTHGDKEYNPGGCATCHMATAVGVETGGHTWRVHDEEETASSQNVSGCNQAGCHKTVESFDHWGVQSEIEGLLDDLRDELVRLKIKDPGDNLYAVPGTYKADIAAAFLNFQLFSSDHSGGLHNPPYVRSVLTNSIAKMKTY